MTPADIDRVFGRGRLRMVTGDHVEVFREESLPGERRRYTKRFLATAAGDFSEWTEREWRILARLVGHGIKPVPDVVRFDRGAADQSALVQTYDAGVTVDHWATLLPLERDGTTLGNVFEDCAHWWALARHCLIALDAIHELRLVHLDLKADNVCIPVGPADFDPHSRGQRLQPRFDEIALIDFAFSLVSGERLESALPIAQQADYEYQSPRLLGALEAGRHGDLGPTRQLDWRCDLFSLAAMLSRYLPELEDTTAGCWNRSRHADARALVRRLIEAHDAELPARRPHAELIALASEPLAQPPLRESLQRGWTLAFDGRVAAAATPTPVTRIALPVVAAVAAAAAPRTPVAPVAAPLTPARMGIPVSPPPVASIASPPGSPMKLQPVAPDSGHDDAREALAVDPTDVAMRMQERRRGREQRAGRLAWAGGLTTAAVIAVAAVAWLEPMWRPLPGMRDLPVSIAQAPTPAPRRAAPVVAVAAAPVAPAPTPQVVEGPGKPTDIAVATPGEPSALMTTPAPAPTPAPPPRANAPAGDASSGAAPVGESPATVAAAKSSSVATVARSAAQEPSRARVLARGQTAEPMPPRPALARHARSAMPFPARVQLARSGTPAPGARPPASHPARLAVVAPSRRPAGANAWPGNGAPIPWAVAGRAAPRVAIAKASGERGALLPSSTGPLAIAATPARTADPGASAFVNVNAPASAPPAAPAAAPPPTALAVVAKPSLSADTAPLVIASTAPATAAPAAVGDTAIDYAARAAELMASQLPRLAQRAERLVARVLFVAGRSEHVPGNEEIRAAAAAIGRDGGDALAGLAVSAREAQRLGEAARTEYARRGGTAEALALQARAFGANPLDVEAAGNLAFLLLRQRPAQAEAARQLALHALTLHGTRYPQGRIEDWATLAIASALAGRERDAKNAFLVTLSLAPNLERQCKAALDVYAIYGERLRAPVEAMLDSANASGRANGSSSCEWPPRWVVTGASR